MFSLFNYLLASFIPNFSMQISPAYDAASQHLSSKGIKAEDIFVFIVFGVIALVFLIFLVFVYFRERNKPRY